MYIMDMVIPRELDYTKPEQLPASVRCSSLVAVPQGGRNGYSSGTQIMIPLVQYGYFVPNSAYLTAKISVTGTANANSLLSVVAQSWISRLDTFINSQSVETQNQYGAVSSMLLHSKMSTADKWGLSYPFGIKVVDGDANNVDSHSKTGVGTHVFQIAIPLNCILQNAEKMIPLRMGETRIVLTVNDLANFSVKDDLTASELTGLVIDEVEYHYDIVEFDAQTDAMILSQTDEQGDMYFKSESYASSSAQINNGTQGFLEIPFATSLASIKSIYGLFCRTDRAKFFASYDPTQGNGSVQFTVAGATYPPKALDTINARSAVVLEHLAAAHGTKTSPDTARCCLSELNFRNSNVVVGEDSVTDLAKAFFGVSTEKISGSYLMTGISSQNSNSTVRVQIGTALTSALNLLCVFNHDALIRYSPSTGQVQILK
jgi:hypothetical protein